MYLVDTQGRPSEAAGLEVSAARRRRRHDDPARRHRRGRREGGPPSDAARPASLDALRRRRVPRRRLGRRAVERPTRRSVAFVSTSRDHKQDDAARRRRGDRRVRDVLEETVADVLRVGQRRVNWRYLPASNEVIWFSERDNWGQLYLYDLQTGKLKHQITTGDGNVTQLLRVDEKSRAALLPGGRPREGPRSVLHAPLPRRTSTAGIQRC